MCPAGRRRRTNQLWHFLLDQLRNPEHYDSIRWVNRTAGVFRFLKSQEVAQRWGQRKQKKAMTYEYMSRAMRHYYAQGIMRRIDGKRLTYQFGPNAENWKNLADDKNAPKMQANAPGKRNKQWQGGEESFYLR